MSSHDVLKVCCPIDDVADGVACLLHRKQILGRKERQNVDEDFCWEIEKGVHGVVAAIYPTVIGFLLSLYRIGIGIMDTTVGRDRFGTHGAYTVSTVHYATAAYYSKLLFRRVACVECHSAGPEETERKRGHGEDTQAVPVMRLGCTSSNCDALWQLGSDFPIIR